MRLFLIILLSILALPAQAQDVTLVKHEDVTGRFLSNNSVSLPASSSVKPLPARQPRPNEQGLLAAAELLFKDNPAIGMIMIDNGEVIFERYGFTLSESTEFFSFSMSKTLTAVATGKALCATKIESLDDKAGRYAPEVVNTPQDAPLRSILTMTSGGRSSTNGRN